MNVSGFRVCVQELFGTRYDLLSVSYAVLTGKQIFNNYWMRLSTIWRIMHIDRRDLHNYSSDYPKAECNINCFFFNLFKIIQTLKTCLPWSTLSSSLHLPAPLQIQDTREDASKYRPEVYESEKSKILKKIHKAAPGKPLT